MYSAVSNGFCNKRLAKCQKVVHVINIRKRDKILFPKMLSHYSLTCDGIKYLIIDVKGDDADTLWKLNISWYILSVKVLSIKLKRNSINNYQSCDLFNMLAHSNF